MTSCVRAAAVAATLLWAFDAGMAQTAQVPNLGFVIDRAHQGLHTVLGVPGAAVVAPANETDGVGIPLAVSSHGGYAILLAGDDATPAVWQPQAPLRRLPGLSGAPDRIALSPQGKAAALYYRGEGRIVTFAGLPGAPGIAARVDWKLPQDGTAPFAVSDDGRLVLAADSQLLRGGGRSLSWVVVLGSGGEVARLPLAGPATAAAFASNSADALIATASEAFLVRNAAASGSVTPIRAGGLDAISAAALSPDGNQVLLASSHSARVAIVRLDASSPPVILNCDCAVSELDRINDTAYRLTPYSGGVAWILDASNSPRILSVPAAPAPGNQP